jgi:hypothetical protein
MHIFSSAVLIAFCAIKLFMLWFCEYIHVSVDHGPFGDDNGGRMKIEETEGYESCCFFSVFGFLQRT